MTDLFIKPVPLPIPRPLMEETVLGCSTDCRMPLEASRKAAGELFDIGSYPTSGEGTKRISELPRGLQSILEKIHEMNTQFFGWLSDSFVATRGPDWLDVMIFLFIVGAVIITGMVIWTALRLFVEWVVGNRE